MCPSLAFSNTQVSASIFQSHTVIKIRLIDSPFLSIFNFNTVCFLFKHTDRFHRVWYLNFFIPCSQALYVVIVQIIEIMLLYYGQQFNSRSVPLIETFLPLTPKLSFFVQSSPAEIKCKTESLLKGKVTCNIHNTTELHV